MKKILAAALILALLLCGCDTAPGDVSGNSTSPVGGNSNPAAPEDVDFSATDEDMFTDRDLSGDYADGTRVDLSEGSFTVTEEGTYLLSGKLENGMITVDAPDTAKVQLVLDGVEIFCESGAPICILEGDKVFLTLAEGSENKLENGQALGTAGEYELDAVIYSRSDLTINGTGTLEIVSPAGHGISCKDDLVIAGGNISVTSANHGLDANDSVRIKAGNLTLRAGKDGIHAENADDAAKGFVYISGGGFDIEAEGDGISAGSYLQLENGEYRILCGGGYENGNKSHSDGWGQMGGMQRPGSPGSSDTSTSTESSESMKGLKAAAGLLISGGEYELDTADDAIHSDASVTVNGGTFTIATGDDGVHAEDTLTITDCHMTVKEAYEGLEAANVVLRGGTMWLNCSDDGLNAAGGVDESGTTGGRDGMFGGGPGGRPNGGPGGMMGGDYGSITISGGKLTIYSGGDGLDSNGDLTISGGEIYVTNPTSGDVSVLDSQNQPVITGGTYIGLGISTMMAETFSSQSTQGVIACSCRNQAAGSQLTITDSDGNTVLELTSEYSTAILIISTPQIIKGESYEITFGNISGTVDAQ